MNADRVKVIQATCEQIRIDVEKDIKDLEGGFFNGNTVGKFLGFIGAEVYTLAGMLSELAEEAKADDAKADS